MTSRLERLLCLLDNGSTTSIRSAAAKQLGEIQQTHPSELQNLLQKVYVYLKSKSWETRVAAGEAISAIIVHVPPHPPVKCEKDPSEYLTLEEYDLQNVLENGKPLLGSSGAEYDVAASENETSDQKQRLTKQLGLSIGNVNITEGLIHEDDFVVSPHPPSRQSPDHPSQHVGHILNGKDSMSARERNKAKRKARLLSRQNSHRDNAKRQKVNESCEEQAAVIEWPIPDSEDWVFDTLVSYLLEDIISTEWVERHGGAMGLRSLVTHHRYTEKWMIDLSLRLVSVLALDRFGDYVSHEVVAPVRETIGQVLGILTRYFSVDNLQKLQLILLQLLQATEWQARHGGLLGIKYLLAARQDVTAEFLAQLVPHIISSISDDDDDVRSVAASSLVPVSDKLDTSLPPATLFSLSDMLWSSLQSLDDLSASTNSIISLLAVLLKSNSLVNYYNPPCGDIREGKSQTKIPLTTLVPTLQPLLSHNVKAVRRETLCTLDIALHMNGTWIDVVAPLFARTLYQRMFLEVEESIVPCIIKAWKHLFSATSIQVRTKILEDHIPLWCHLLGAPAGLPLDTSLFINETKSGQFAIPATEHEYRVRKALTQLLGISARYTDVVLYLDQIKSYLDSGCASHKQAACLLTLELVHTCPESVSSLSVSLSDKFKSMLLDNNLVFDELLATNQNLQLSCRGVLTSNPQERSLSPFAKLPSLSVDQALALVEECRRCGIDTPGVATVETMTATLSASSFILCTRVYSLLAGCVVALNTLPDKLNPVIKPLMDCLKKEVSIELQETAATNIQILLRLVCNRSPCPTPKIIKNLIISLLDDKAQYPDVNITTKPYLFANRGSTGVPCTPITPNSATPATPNSVTPATPKSAQFCPEVFAQLSGITSTDGMISYVTHILPSTSNTRRARSHVGEAELTEEERFKSFISNRGAALALNTVSSSFGEELLDKVPILQEDIISVVTSPVPEDISIESVDKLLVGLYVLECVFSSFKDKLQEKIMDHIGNINDMLCNEYTAVRYAACRLLTNLALRHPVTVFNYFLSHTIKKLESSCPRQRSGVVECIYCLVQTLELKIVPYVVLLVIPVLRRMGDNVHHTRSVATLTFAQLVRLIPLDGVLATTPGLDESLVVEKAKQKEFLEQLLDPSQIKDCTIPIKIYAKLRRYQQEGVNWLWFLCQFGLHGVLCDDMGLGKTLQTLCIIGTATYNRRKEQEDDTLASLVVCPPTLVGHWFYETEKFVDPHDLRPIMYHGTSGERLQIQNKISSHKFNLVICSYDVLRNDAEFLTKIRWNYCVLDEGHVIKNTKTKVSQAIQSIKAQHRLILSGTPIQNNVLELWGLFEWLMPGFLGTEQHFQDTFSKPINLSRDAKSSSREQEAGALALESLHRQVLPFLLRRVKDDVLQDLPPKIIQDYYCHLTPKQHDLYDKFSETFNAVDLNSESKIHVFQSLQYLRKVCNHPIMVHGLDIQSVSDVEDIYKESGKLIALKQLLTDCGIGEAVVSPHRALVFCQLKGMLDIIEKFLLKPHLPNVSYLRLDGSTPTADRVPLVNRFNSDPSYDLLLLTTSVGGLGLNLTGADTVIFIEHDWNPSKDLQAMDRAHRIGQKNVVNVYRLITKDTLEERIMGLQKFKLNIANTVISSENASLQQMGNSGLVDLFNVNSKTETKATEKKPIGKSLSAMLESMGQLWDDEDYEKEYNLQSFITSLAEAKKESGESLDSKPSINS